jgi:hypothetical protein
VTTELVTVQIGCCLYLDAMNTAQAALTWLSTGRDRIHHGGDCSQTASAQPEWGTGMGAADELSERSRAVVEIVHQL